MKVTIKKGISQFQGMSNKARRKCSQIWLVKSVRGTLRSAYYEGYLILLNAYS